MAVQTYTGLTAEQMTFYNRSLLDRLLPSLVFYNYGQKKPVPKNNGDKVNFRRFDSLDPATELTEGVVPSGNSISITAVEAQLKQYGDFITVSEFTLKEVIRQTIFSIADSDTNKMMTGELFEIEDNILKVVSLDGHRISIRKIELKDSYAPKKVIVPGKTLQEISKIIGGEAEADVDISFTKNHIVFEFDRTVVVSRLIEGEYFRIDQMLSSDYETKARINKKELLDCIDRATLLIKEGDKKPIIIDIKDESMEFKIKSQIGSMDEEIMCLKEGKDLLIGFNPKFLIDALRVIDDEEVDLYFMNAKAPLFIKDAEQSYIYLILPVNFNAAI